jgi:hypothetical protein
VGRVLVVVTLGLVALTLTGFCGESGAQPLQPVGNVAVVDANGKTIGTFAGFDGFIANVLFSVNGVVARIGVHADGFDPTGVTVISGLGVYYESTDYVPEASATPRAVAVRSQFSDGVCLGYAEPQGGDFVPSMAIDVGQYTPPFGVVASVGPPPAAVTATAAAR